MKRRNNAVKKLYKKLGFEKPDIFADYDNGYLSFHIARNARPVFWYLDECNNVAIYEDTAEFLTDEEIENFLQ